ncbi:hypothetical protein [Pseudonocardia sp. N23]|uniref:hypothetical protein n=1 Tax=Pseudonocardia sp. N23 TaxID=1987376 RepID=UPI000C031013|nr:hypothetical protein [Pseudonocardia sp. N23]GAY10419.1 hypothetical protein TOK_4780 [Pseudonocardia sp. N23]
MLSSQDRPGVPAGVPTPGLVLVRRAGSGDELVAGANRTMCCLRSTVRGARAVVYRSGRDQGIVGVVDFTSDAVARADRGWEAAGVFRPVERPLSRAALLDDPVLGPVFAHLQSRRRLPEDVGRTLRELLPVRRCRG